MLFHEHRIVCHSGGPEHSGFQAYEQPKPENLPQVETPKTTQDWGVLFQAPKNREEQEKQSALSEIVERNGMLWTDPDVRYREQPWRYLDFKNMMAYRRIDSEELRARFMKNHQAEIERNYARDKAYYQNRVPASMKVPFVVASPFERNELAPDVIKGRVLLIGGSVSEGVGKDLPAENKQYIPADSPLSALKNLEENIKQNKPADLKGASAVLAFDPDMFASPQADQMVTATQKLLQRLRELDMKIVMTSPLKTGNHRFTGHVPDFIPAGKNTPEPVMIPPGAMLSRAGFTPETYRNAIMIQRWRTDYWNQVCDFHKAGLVDSLIDLGTNAEGFGLLSGIRTEWRNEDPNRPGLNKKGITAATNGVIDALNWAHGQRTGSTNADDQIAVYGTENISFSPAQKPRRLSTDTSAMPTETQSSAEETEKTDPLFYLKDLERRFNWGDKILHGEITRALAMSHFALQQSDSLHAYTDEEHDLIQTSYDSLGEKLYFLFARQTIEQLEKKAKEKGPLSPTDSKLGRETLAAATNGKLHIYRTELAELNSRFEKLKKQKES